MGYAKEDTFRICGFMKSSDLNKEKKMYFVMNSMEYAKQMIPEADREYRVMFRLADAEHMTTDEIVERGKEIGEDFGVPEGNVVENREYLAANYTDPSFVKGMIVVIVMVVLAGILTIYSIYYVSMIPKVQEYGKLKAIGSTKRQIRQMVFREGMLVTALALPVGLLISSFLSRWIMKQMITFMAGEDPLMQVAAELVKNGEVSLLHWWIYAITIMAVLFTSAVSLAKPMRIAAKVSPIEAMRYQGLEKRGKKVRKGYQNLTIFRLTKANMARNKKRTGITIVTIGATGILFMVVATILSCAAPKEIARKDIESDYKIKLETWGGDKMNPDRDWRQVQQNNPLTKAFIDQVRDVDGVEEVVPSAKRFITSLLESRVEEGRSVSYITSAKKKDEDKLMFTVTRGFDLLLSRYQKLCAQRITGKKGDRLLFYVTPFSDLNMLLNLLSMLNVVDFTVEGGVPSVGVRVRDAEILKKEAASGNYQNHVLENNEKIFQEQIELFRLFFGNTKLSDEQRWEFIEDYFTGMSLEGLKEKYSCVVE